MTFLTLEQYEEACKLNRIMAEWSQLNQSIDAMCKPEYIEMMLNPDIFLKQGMIELLCGLSMNNIGQSKEPDQCIFHKI
jgi:hypothetical protein